MEPEEYDVAEDGAGNFMVYRRGAWHASTERGEPLAPIPAPEWGAGATELPDGTIQGPRGPRGGAPDILRRGGGGSSRRGLPPPPAITAEARNRLIFGISPAARAQQRLTEQEKGGATPYNEDWVAATVDGLPDFGLLGGIARTWGGQDYQDYDQAVATISASLLPIFSGMAVTESEAERFVRANTPRVGDTAETLEEKARNRSEVINAGAWLLGRDLPFPEVGIYGQPGYEPRPADSGGPAASSGTVDGVNTGTGRLPGGNIGVTGSGRPLGQNGLPVVNASTRQVADRMFDSTPIVERDGQPFYSVSLKPGEGAPADLVARIGQDGSISTEEMVAAGYVPDEASGRWLYPVNMSRLPSNDGVGAGGAAPAGPAGGGGGGAPDGGSGGDPEMQVGRGGSQWLRDLEEARKRERAGQPVPLRMLADAYRGWETFAQSATEQIPGLDELAAWAASKLSGTDYADVRNAQRDFIEYENANDRGARVAGGIAGAVATVATPIGAPLRLTNGASLGARVVNRGAGGALGGTLYGFAADDGNAFERLDGAGGGAVYGAAGGVVAPWLAGRVNAFGEVVSDAARFAGRGVGNVGVARGIPGAQRMVDALAPRNTPLERGIEKFAQRSPQQAEVMRANLNAMSGETIEPTFADAINDGGRGTIRALATRQTPARDVAREFAEGRAVDIQDRISTQARRTISDDPRTPDEIRDAALKEARNASRPLYERAYEQPIEITPEIEDLISRPAGRRALERARNIAANEGRNPDELRLFPVEDWGLPTGGGSAVPRAPADPNVAADLAALRGGVGDRRAGQGKTLMQFVAENGGIRDEWGELAAIGTDGWSRAAPWRRQILQENGVDLETMAQRALEAGYFDDLARPGMEGADNMSVVGRDALLEAFDREMAGTPRYAREANPADAMRAGRRGALEERLSREGLDPRNTTPRDAAQAFDAADDFEARATAQLEGSPPGPPPVDIVRGTQPTMETLDYIKRGLDDVLETYRDPVSGKLRLNDEGRAIAAAREQYRKALIDINPVYGEALAAYEGPIRLQRATRIGEGVLSTEADRFASEIESLRNPREIEVAQAAARRAIERAAGTQGQAPGVARRLATGREMQSKMAKLVGPARASGVQRAMAAEMAALRNARAVSPAVGSPTNQNQQDTLAAAGDMLGLAGDVATVNAPGIFRRGLDLVKSRFVDFNDAQAEAVVRAAVDPSQTQQMLTVLSDRMRPREFRNLSRAVRHQLNSNLLQSQPEAQRQ